MVVILGFLVVVAAAVGLWWKSRPGPVPKAPPVAAADPWAGADNSALIAKKRASRGDRPVDQRPAVLGGVVRRAADGSGVAGAVVTVESRAFGGAFVTAPQTDEPIDVVTDAAGAWTVPAIKPGAYVVSAAAPELLPASVDVDVAPATARGDLVLSLEAGGATVSGLVEDIGGGAIGGARVTVRPSGLASLSSARSFAALTDADGRYRLSLPDGSWEATASQADYTDDSEDFQVRGRPVGLDFTLTPAATIRGVVVARDTGKPVPGLQVTASGGRGGRGREVGARGAALSDDRGAFVLRGAGSGALALVARGRGYASAEPTVLEVGIGEEVAGVTVLVDRAYDVSGFVVRKGTDGDGVGGVRVGLFSFGGSDVTFAAQPSADDGYFEILGINPGRYMVAALGDGVMPELGQPVPVVDRDVTDLLVTVDAGATLRGRVTPPAIAGLSIEIDMDKVGLGNLFELAKTAMVHGTSDAGGEFTLTSVPPGTLTLRAQTGDGRVGKLAVTVTAADQSGLEIPLEARGAISGRVVDPTGAAVAGVTVEARGAANMIMRIDDDGPSSAVTGPDGGFRVGGLDPGSVRLTVSDKDGPLTWAPGVNLDTTEFTIKGADEIRGVKLVVEARDGVIRGVVLDADRRPVGDAWVTARSSASPWSAEMAQMRAAAEARAGGDAGAAPATERPPPSADDESEEMGDDSDDGDDRSWGRGRTVLTGDDGSFTISTLRRGTYRVTAEATKGATRAQATGVKTGDRVTLVLAPLAALTVSVAAAGAPVATYDLVCQGATTVQRSVRAADGTTRLDRLPPGRYRCTATADAGVATETSTVTGDSRLALTLGAWSTVTGVVVDGAGRPRAGLRIVVAGAVGDITGAMQEALTGGGIKTDAAGRFEVGRLGPGEASVMVFEDGRGFGPVVSTHVTIAAGQRHDVGTLTAPTLDDAAGDAGP